MSSPWPPSTTLRHAVTLMVVGISAGAMAWVVVERHAVGLGTLWLGLGVATLVCGVCAILRGRAQLHSRELEEHLPRHYCQPDRHPGARWLYYAGMFTMPLLALRFGSTTCSDYLFFAALGVTVVDVLADSSYRVSALPPLLLVGLGLVGSGALVATAGHSLDPIGSVGILARLVYLLTIWFLLGATVLRTPEHLRTAVTAWVAGAALCGFVGVGQVVGLVPGGLDPTGRVAGLAQHVDALGGLTSIAAIPALLLAYTMRKIRYVACAVGTLSGLVLSGTVGAGLALLGGLLVCLVSSELTRAVLVAAAIAGAALVYGAATGHLQTNSNPIERFQQTTGADGTLAVRVEVVKVAWQHIQEEPLIGTGLDDRSSRIYSYTSGHTHQVHNTVVQLWYEAGLLGVIGILLILTSFFTIAWQSVTRSRGRDRALASALLASVLTFVLLAMSQPLIYQRFALAPAALAFALYAIQARVIVLRPDGAAVPTPNVTRPWRV